MKHSSRWPFVLRLAACVAAYFLIWGGPLLLGFAAMKHWIFSPEFSQGERTAFEVLWLFGWSILISRTVLFRFVEPYFNVKSTQNPFHHLFRPEPLYFRSFREWFHWMFCGVEEEQPPTGLSARGLKRAARRKRR